MFRRVWTWYTAPFRDTPIGLCPHHGAPTRWARGAGLAAGVVGGLMTAARWVPRCSLGLGVAEAIVIVGMTLWCTYLALQRVVSSCYSGCTCHPAPREE
ncbi:MAG: hypothetical protein M0Z36_10735 [Thermaerobacter sp.]|nr:hypothetical protein [Thermaerobacter sp.]